jgi:glutamate-5-semialdehyde dehydrogenase
MNLRETAEKAKGALPALAASPGAVRDALLSALAGLLEERSGGILEANREDMAKARAAGLPGPMLDRLELTPPRVRGLAQGIREVASLPDPLGGVEDFKELPSGLRVGRMRVPLGLIAFICEARPGAVAEAAAMALKSGNALLVKPGKESYGSSAAIGALIGEALSGAGLPLGAVAVLSGLPREGILEIVGMDDLVDLVIPRGGEGLVRFVAENSRVPVLKHFKGVCHLYVDKGADPKMAASLAIDGKTNRPGTCNALECLLVHQDEAEGFFKELVPGLVGHKVAVRACPRSKPHLSGLGALLGDASEGDWGREFLGLTLAVRTVPGMGEALAHIARHGSNHTEAIATNDLSRAREFLRKADAGCVLVNASTRLNDGGCLGLGAEMGISTSKLQAYGPMGLLELTSRKFVVLGTGQLRG